MIFFKNVAILLKAESISLRTIQFKYYKVIFHFKLFKLYNGKQKTAS